MPPDAAGCCRMLPDADRTGRSINPPRGPLNQISAAEAGDEGGFAGGIEV